MANDSDCEKKEPPGFNVIGSFPAFTSPDLLHLVQVLALAQEVHFHYEE